MLKYLNYRLQRSWLNLLEGFTVQLPPLIILTLFINERARSWLLKCVFPFFAAGVAISSYAKYCYRKLTKAALTGAKKVCTIYDSVLQNYQHPPQ